MIHFGNGEFDLFPFFGEIPLYLCSMDFPRKIIHVDMDAFYASVEQLDNPALRGKPVAVGGNSQRGVISAASYEARKFGVKSAMSSKIAAQKCPQLIFVRHRFDRYKEISDQVREIFQRYTDLIEPLSLDEAYLDVTYNKLQLPSATFVAQAIKNDIRNELGLIASAGVSYNKFLAKMASDQDKPDGLFIIRPKDALSFLDNLPIDRFYGVGKVTAQRMHELGIYHGKDLKERSLSDLIQWFGKSGKFFYHVVRGIDNRQVISERERKSLAAERTFMSDIATEFEFKQEASRVLEIFWQRYQRFAIPGKTLTMKVKFSDFTVQTRSQTFAQPLADLKVIQSEAKHLQSLFLPLELPVRLIGFQVSGFVQEEEESGFAEQLTLDF